MKIESLKLKFIILNFKSIFYQTSTIQPILHIYISTYIQQVIYNLDVKLSTKCRLYSVFVLSSQHKIIIDIKNVASFTTF